jgi:hypothetical protein
VAEERWRVEVTRRGLTRQSALLPEVAGASDDWLGGEDIPDGVPFLVAPGLEYDVDLNQYFLRPAMVGSPRNTPLSWPVRGRPWKRRRCAPTVLTAWTPVRYTSVDSAI